MILNAGLAGRRGPLHKRFSHIPVLLAFGQGSDSRREVVALSEVAGCSNNLVNSVRLR